MAYSVYTFASQYTDTGLTGFYVGTRAENLADCLEIANEQIAEVAEGKLRKGELERAKENLKGRILLSMESTSNRMSRLGRSLITDTELLSIDRIAAESPSRRTPWRSWQRCCWRRRSSRRLESGRARSGSATRSGASSRSCPPALQREGQPLRCRREGGLGARACAGSGGTRARRPERRRGDGRLHVAASSRGQHRGAPSMPACPASSGRAAGTLTR